MARHSPITELEKMFPSCSRSKIYNICSGYKFNSLEECYNYFCEMKILFKNINKRIKKGKK